MKTSYTITGSQHADGAQDVVVVRETKEEAERVATLHMECGYRKVTTQARMVNEGGTELADIPANAGTR
jgi:hypothetical protein